MDITHEEVFSAVRRGYNDLSNSSDNQIQSYFSEIDSDSLEGHFSNIKGILFEQEYIDQLHADGVHSSIFSETNHPVTDITIFDDDMVAELQLKATDSVAYINTTLADHPDIEIVTTTEVAEHIDSDMVTDSGIENSALEEAVSDTLSPVSPLGLIKLSFGLY